MIYSIDFFVNCVKCLQFYIIALIIFTRDTVGFHWVTLNPACMHACIIPIIPMISFLIFFLNWQCKDDLCFNRHRLKFNVYQEHLAGLIWNTSSPYTKGGSDFQTCPHAVFRKIGLSLKMKTFFFKNGCVPPLLVVIKTLYQWIK